MLDIVILAVGSVKTNFFRSAIDEYLKRLTPYARIFELEVRPSKLAGADKTKAKNEEAERLETALLRYDQAEIFLLEEFGKEYDSCQFAKVLPQNKKCVFVIGGSAGLGDVLRKNNRRQLSLSTMTFNHEMARAMLCEQLYRAVTIINGKDYHY